MVFVAIFQTLIIYLIDALLAVMMLRAILSWFDPEQEWKISYFAYCITEPLILPIRRLCERKRWFEMTPLDVPFFLTTVLLLVIQTFVSLL